MKADIHPNYVDCIIRCACGATYHTRSTRSSIDIGICSACHPFFTGEQKFVDTAGRVEKFSRRYGATRLAGTAAPKPPKPVKPPKPAPAKAAKPAKTAAAAKSAQPAGAS